MCLPRLLLSSVGTQHPRDVSEKHMGGTVRAGNLGAPAGGFEATSSGGLWKVLLRQGMACSLAACCMGLFVNE